MMESMDVNAHLARRVTSLRKARGWTMEQLAEQSGVSRSTISVIERAETSAPAVVLHKLAGALGVSLPALFAEDARTEAELPLSRAAQQPAWTDPASGYVRRNLSPPGYRTPIELVEVTFPARQRIVFENAAATAVTHQQVWMLDGEMDVTVGATTWRLKKGDCLAMRLAGQVAFENRTRRAARYAVAVTTVAQEFAGRG